MRYINSCLAKLAEPAVHSIEPTAEAAADWHQRTQNEIKQMVWSHPASQALLLQERRRRDPHRQPVAAQRILGRDPRARLVGVHHAEQGYSTVTDLARLRGLSTS